MIKELRHVGLAQFPRMTFAVKENKLPYPIAVGFFCAWAEVPTPADFMNLIHQASW